MSDRSGRSRRVPLLSAFLTATVVLAVWLGWEAVNAAGSHRQTAEAVLRDYAWISLTAFEHAVDDDLDDLLDTAFDDVDGALRDFRGGVPDPREIGWELDEAARAAGCRGCAAIRDPLLLFAADLATGQVRWTAPSPAAAGLGRSDVRDLAELVSRHRPDLVSSDDEGVLALDAGRVGPDPTLAGYMLARDSVGGTRVMGFVVSRGAFTELFAEWFEDTRLLPEPIGGELPNDSLLNVTVRTADGVPLYTSPVVYPSDLAVTRELEGAAAGLAVDLAVRPDQASEVIIGGLPSSRLPLLMALLLVTLGVGAAALVQFRRERRFQRLRDDFVSGVSHELRTPLAQIRMFAELQDSGRLTSDDDRRRAARVIHRESRRLSHLVENILQFSRLRYAEGPDVIREEVDLAEGLDDGIDAMQSLLRDRGMELGVEREAGLRVLANRDALTRIVVNLLDNATKYGPEGQTVRVILTGVDGTARLRVEDEGPGVPRADRERIWKPYRRLERDVARRLPGTGIGLAVVRELVEMLGGSTRVEDGPEGGARFVVELPLVDRASDASPDPVPPPAAAGASV